MATQKRLIGEQYDHEKFDNGFRRAAYAMVAEGYTSPSSPAGKTLQNMFFDTMKFHMARIPTEYYQVLEAFADGIELDGLAEGRVVDTWRGTGDARLTKLMMEIVTGSEETELRLCDPEAAERYYDERFTEKA